MKNTYIIVFVILSLLVESKAQDLDVHFSQFFLLPTHHNPALIGLSNADIRAAGVYRKQWAEVPVPYTTFGGFVETRMRTKRDANGVFSIGLNILDDEAGDGLLSNQTINLAGSYLLKLDATNSLSVGLSTGGGQRSFDRANLRHGSQYSTERFQYDPTIPSGESFDNEQVSYFDMGAGVNWRYSKPNGVRIDAGLGVSHLTQPEISFTGSESKKWDMRQSLYTRAILPVKERIFLRLHALSQWQATKHELVLGGGALFDISSEPEDRLAIGASINWRQGDAIIPAVEFQYERWQLGVSYDVNTSDFRIATNRRGGIEVMLAYLFTHVNIDDTAGFCPVF